MVHPIDYYVDTKNFSALLEDFVDKEYISFIDVPAAIHYFGEGASDGFASRPIKSFSIQTPGMPEVVRQANEKAILGLYDVGYDVGQAGRKLAGIEDGQVYMRTEDAKPYYSALELIMASVMIFFRPNINLDSYLKANRRDLPDLLDNTITDHRSYKGTPGSSN